MCSHECSLKHALGKDISEEESWSYFWLCEMEIRPAIMSSYDDHMSLDWQAVAWQNLWGPCAALSPLMTSFHFKPKRLRTTRCCIQHKLGQIIKFDLMSSLLQSTKKNPESWNIRLHAFSCQVKGRPNLLFANSQYVFAVQVRSSDKRGHLVSQSV